MVGNCLIETLVWHLQDQTMAVFTLAAAMRPPTLRAPCMRDGDLRHGHAYTPKSLAFLVRSFKYGDPVGL